MESFSHSTRADNDISDIPLLILPWNKRRKTDNVGQDYVTWVVDDGISQLSDDILINIVSRLTLREAARTCILSSRWRYLWKHFIGCLDFDNPLVMADYKWKLRLGREPLDVERHKFVNWVNRVLRSLHGKTMEGLRICFDVFTNSNTSVIDNWIKFAVEKRVRRLELDFTSSQVQSSWCAAQYNFLSSLLSDSSFTSLTSLSLAYVGITGEFLQHLLSYCPSLDVLSVTDSNSLTSLRVSGPSLKLRYLKLELLPYLMILKFRLPISYLFNFLEQKSLFLLKMFQILLSFLKQLHTLKLNLILDHVVLNAVGPFHNIPELCNLKYLEMTINLSDDDRLLPCAALLKASPSLYKFVLKLFHVTPSSGSAMTVKDHPYLSVSKLSIEVVELIGFVGHTTEVEFVSYLIENADNLEKIIIDPCLLVYHGSPKESWCRRTEQYRSARKRALDLKAAFPLWEFVIP